MLAMLGLPYTGYAHAILCWCFMLAYSDSNIVVTGDAQPMDWPSKFAILSLLAPSAFACQSLTYWTRKLLPPPAFYLGSFFSCFRPALCCCSLVVSGSFLGGDLWQLDGFCEGIPAIFASSSCTAQGNAPLRVKSKSTTVDESEFASEVDT